MTEISQEVVDTLRGELREANELIKALEASKTDAERLLSKEIDRRVKAEAQVLAKARQAVAGPLEALIKGPTRTESMEARGLVEQASELAEEALESLDALKSSEDS